MTSNPPHSLEERVEPSPSVATLEAALTIIHDRLNDPALGEAIEQLQDCLSKQAFIDLSHGPDRKVVRVLLDALVSLRSPAL